MLVFSITFYFLKMKPFRGGSRTSATSKMELFVVLVNCWILDAAEVLDTPQRFYFVLFYTFYPFTFCARDRRQISLLILSEFKRIIGCSEIPFSKILYHTETSQLICIPKAIDWFLYDERFYSKVFPNRH